MLVLSCIFFGDLAFEATTGASSELAGTFGLAMLSGGHGRPPATPGHVHEFLQSVGSTPGLYLLPLALLLLPPPPLLLLLLLCIIGCPFALFRCV